MAELRFNLGYGYLKLKLHNPIQAMVDMRGCGVGFYYDKHGEQIIWTNPVQFKNYNKISKALKKGGHLMDHSQGVPPSRL